MHVEDRNEAKKDFSFKSFFEPLTTTKAITWIVIIGLIVYCNSLFNGFVGDDEGQIVGNILIQSINNIPIIFHSVLRMKTNTGITTYYKPITFSVITLLHTFFGLSPFFYHLVQMVLHISNGIMVYLLFKKHIKKVIAFFAAILFLIHPINAETVSYIADLQDVLYVFFGLFALHLSIMNWQSSKFKYILISIMLLASCLSKETGVVFLITIPLYSFIFIHKQLKPIFLSTIIAFIIYLFLRFSSQPIVSSGLYTSAISTLNFQQRLLSIPKIVLHYVLLFVYPNQLAIGWNWVVTHITFADFILPTIVDFIFLLLVFAYLVFLFKKKSKTFKTYSFFTMWFVIGLLPHLQFIPLDFTVADRWFYFSLIGLLGMLATITETLHFSSKTVKIIIVSFYCLLLFIFSIRTINRNSNFHDDITLYSHDLKFIPDNSVLENGLGVAYANEGNIPLAKMHYERSIKLDIHSESWNNLGAIYANTGNIKIAKEDFQKSVEFSNMELSYENLAKLDLLYGSPQDAKQITEQGLKIYSDNPLLWFMLAQAEYKLGNKNMALTDAQKSIELAPNESVSQFINYVDEEQK